MDVTRLTQHTAQVSDRLAGALAGAFYDDPFFVYVMEDAGRRMARLEWWMRCALRYGMAYGEVYATAALSGAAIWLPPGAPDVRIARAMSAGWWQAPWRLGLSATRRLWSHDAAGDAVRKRVPVRRWYLMTLGVAPEHQNRGAGSALLQPVLAAADTTGMPCFLETATTLDVEFYRKHGFDIVDEHALGAGDRFWAMLRPASGVRSPAWRPAA